MATDGVLVAAAADVTRLVSSQLARKQVNGAERAAGASSDGHERSSTARGDAAGVHQVQNIPPC